MTGGAFKNSSNLLSRRREIEEFEKDRSEIKTGDDGDGTADLWPEKMNAQGIMKRLTQSVQSFRKRMSYRIPQR